MNDRRRAGTNYPGQHGEGPEDGEHQGGLRWLATFVARGSARARALLAMILVSLAFIGGAVAYDVSGGDEATTLGEGSPAGLEDSGDLVGGTTGFDPEEAEDASEEADEQRGVAAEAERFLTALLGGKNPSVKLADLALAGIGGEKLSESFSGEAEEIARKEEAAEEPSGRRPSDAVGDGADASEEEPSESLLAAATQGFFEASADTSTESANAAPREVEVEAAGAGGAPPVGGFVPAA